MHKVNAHLFGSDVDPDNQADPRALSLHLIGEGKRVLELGRVGERIVRPLQQQGCHVMAIERDRSACAALRKFCTNVICGEVEDLHLVQVLRGRKLDVLQLGSVLEGVSDPAAVLRKLLPFLREDGAVVATISNIAHGSVRLALMDGRFECCGGAVDLDRRQLFTLAQARRTFAESGLAIEQVERIYQDPFEGGWDLASIPEAIKLLIERDPEAAVSRYVIKAVPVSRDATRRLLEALDREEAAQEEQALLSQVELASLRGPELQAQEAQARAERDIQELTVSLEQLEQEAAARLSEAEVHQLAQEQALQAAQQDNRQVAEQVEDLERRLIGATSQVEERDQEIYQLRQRMEHETLVRSKAQAELEEQLESASEQLLASRREARALTEDKAQLEERVRQEQELVHQREAELTEALALSEDQEVQLEVAQQEQLELQWQLTSARQRRLRRDVQLKNLVQSLSEREQAVVTLAGQIEELELWLDDKAREADQHLETIARQRDELAVSEATVQELWQRLSWHKKELVQKNELVGHQTGRILHMSRDLAAGSAEAQELRRLLNQRAAELEQQSDHLARQGTRLLDLDRQREIAEVTKEQLTVAVSELETREQRLDELTEAKQSTEVQLARTNRLMLEQEAQLLELRGMLETKEDEYSSAALSLQAQEAQLAELNQSTRGAKINLTALEQALEAKEQQLSQQQERIVQLEGSLSSAGEEMDRAQRTLLNQLAGLGDQLRGTLQRLGERDGEVAQLEEVLAQAERDTQDLQFGLASHTEQLEQELGSLRASMAWRVVDHYEQAKQALLPPGSLRRAAFDRVVTYALKGNQRALTA